MSDLQKEIPHLVVLAILVLVLLFVVTKFKWVGCKDVPGWCGVYCKINGNSRIALVSGGEGIGDATELQRMIMKETTHYAEPYPPAQLSFGGLNRYELVIVEQARNLSKAEIGALERYMDGGGSVLWIGDAGITGIGALPGENATQEARDLGKAYAEQVKGELDRIRGENASAAKEIRVMITEQGYVPNDIRVQEGDTVRLLAVTQPGTASHRHGITIDAFGVNREVASEDSNNPVAVDFTADKAGSFMVYCGTCPLGSLGSSHPRIYAALNVEPAHEAAPTPKPSNATFWKKTALADYLLLDYKGTLNATNATLRIVMPEHKLVQGLRWELPLAKLQLASVKERTDSVTKAANVFFNGTTYPAIVESKYVGRIVYFAFAPEQLGSSVLIGNIIDYLVNC